jgi:hypothetical protein
MPVLDTATPSAVAGKGMKDGKAPDGACACASAATSTSEQRATSAVDMPRAVRVLGIQPPSGGRMPRTDPRSPSRRLPVVLPNRPRVRTA